METFTIEQLVDKLIGPIQPQGESHIDGQRFDNLKKKCHLIELLIQDVSRAAKDSKPIQHSLQKSQKYAAEFLNELSNEIIGSQ